MPLRLAVLMLISAGMTSGCAGVVLYDGSRNVTKNVVAQVLAEDHPQLAPAAGDCVFAGMTTAEIIGIGTSDTDPVQPSHRAKVAEVLTRAEVTACIAALPATAG